MSRPPFPIEIDASRTPEGGPLGMSAERFLRDYWQQRPLLVRNAFPGFVSPIEPDDLAGLACEDGVLARIVEHDRAADRYRLRTGPFPEDAFPGMPDHDWTLLVQDVDKWDADIAALLEAFRFLPRWRIDDIMVSFAATGGSVGAHIDQYDVFLLQAQGQRHWQIDARPNPPTAFRDDAELRLLRQFDPSHDWVLDPGDMLYLPPGVPHHGVAVNPCLTFSVGTRAPSSAELITDWLDTVVADADDSVRYRDAGMAPPRDPWEIDALAMGRVIEALNALRMNDPDRLGDWFGRFITMYRAGAEAMPAGEGRPRIEVEWDLRAGGALHRHPWTRMAWRRARRGARLYVSGQEFALPVADARALAAAARVDDAVYARLSDTGRDAVIALLDAGHYHLLAPDDGDWGGAEDGDGLEIDGR
ncbi:cupin domain-containing protein [Luteimonas yindakuii]|uniref:cupin domain-containing protein n=1 Tax=Luteimonas yindakuii TaxID=2565782 RepID=UPI0010A2C482|nr:cupin domain-containing protein [Luteimonas yindakuii]QCO67786.1 cupin domain-containing protein [Luteimonas yindakuii]